MKKVLFILVVFFAITSCKKDAVKPEKKQEVSTNTIKFINTVDYNQLKPYLHKNDEKTYVVNFWATWCAPCVKELPYFEKINKEYKDKNVEVLLVSLDFPKQVNKKLIPFINKRNLQSEVILLDDSNENFWINEIDSTWTGAIPATLIYNKNKRKFYEQSFDFKTLENELLTVIN